MVDIHVSSDELNSPRVEEIIAIESAGKNQDSVAFLEDVERPFHENPSFYYSVASGIMAFIAWIIVEPLINEGQYRSPFVGLLFFMVPAALIGLALGMVYGISNRNPSQAAYCGGVGFGLGILLAIPTSLLGGFVYADRFSVCVFFNRYANRKHSRFSFQ